MNLVPINPYYQHGIMPLALDVNFRTYPYQWIEPVTDRMESDVIYARTLLDKRWEEFTTEEKEAYMSGLKGCMNRSDFERIENNIQILVDVLEIKSETYVDNVPEFPTASYFTKMKTNVEAIRAGYAVHADTPKVPELPFNSWQKYNDIERILKDVYEVVSAQFKHFTGEICAGDKVGLLL